MERLGLNSRFALTADYRPTAVLVGVSPLWIDGVDTVELFASLGASAACAIQCAIVRAVDSDSLLSPASLDGPIDFIYHALRLIAVPFFSLVVERTLHRLGKKSGGTRMWKQTFKMFRVSVVKTLMFLGLGGVLLLFSFLPVLNIFAYTAALFLVAFDCMDYSLEAVGYGLGQRMRYMFREWSQWTGMAAGLALTLLLPGSTLLVIPGAVVGAALIFKPENQKP